MSASLLANVMSRSGCLPDWEPSLQRRYLASSACDVYDLCFVLRADRQPVTVTEWRDRFRRDSTREAADRQWERLKVRLGRQGWAFERVQVGHCAAIQFAPGTRKRAALLLRALEPSERELRRMSDERRAGWL